MSDVRAGRPFALRLLNGVGGALRSAGLPLVRLDAASLTQSATQKTGLSHFGDDRFREPLKLLTESFERDARLTFLGRMIARADLLRLLEYRLRVEAVHAAHPEITTAPIVRPLFVLGLPRTGTSILHELLAQDPASRLPMSWEAMHPAPPPERATFDTDPRIAQVEKHFAGVDRLIPDFRTMHPMGALLPQECVALTAYDFASLLFHTANRLTSYQAWLDDADLTWVYRQHRRWLQYLQWKVPADRWVLKSPGHLWALDALLAVYPDARIVQTHRDPLKVIASLVSLICTLRSMASDDIDPYEIGTDWTVRLARGLEHSIDVRARLNLPAAQVFDVQLPEFLHDEIGMVRRIYSHFEMTLSADAEERMRRFLADNRVDKHRRHTYRLALGGLDEATERRRYARYQERFAIPNERVD